MYEQLIPWAFYTVIAGLIIGTAIRNRRRAQKRRECQLLRQIARRWGQTEGDLE